MNQRSVAIFAIVVAIIVGAAIWFLNSDMAFHATNEEMAAASAAKQTPRLVTPSSEPAIPRPTLPPSTPPQPKVTPDPVTSFQMTEDERKIEDILSKFQGNTDAENTSAAQSLINLLPTLGADGQTECINHVNNLLSDEEYQRIMPLWKNTSLNPDVLDAIGTDLMNREDKIKLPALLEAVKLPKHPQREEAMSTLQVFLDEEYGNDVGKWDKAVKEYLKKQADEEAGIPPK